MKVKFNREYIPMLAAFMAVNDIRYYLNGFHVKPHPEQGVVLTSTDGHRLVTIHDKNGLSDGEYILPISKPLIAAAKKTNINKIPLNSVQFIDNKVFVLHHANEAELDFFEDCAESCIDLISHVEYFSVISGRFPNTQRIFSALDFKATKCVGVDVDYISKLKSIVTHKKLPQIELMFNGETGAIASVSGFDNEIVALIMPAKFHNEKPTLPDFVNFGGGAPLSGDKNEKK